MSPSEKGQGRMADLLVLVSAGHAGLLNQSRSTRTLVLLKLLAGTASVLGESLVGLTVLPEVGFGVGLESKGEEHARG